jgi:hypothetical protein
LTIECQNYWSKDSKNYFGKSSLERLTKIIERFGKDIKKMKVIGIKLPYKFVELLNLMGNLEDLEISYVGEFERNFVKGKMELPKLKKVYSHRCQPEILRIFDSLSPGVLQEIFYSVPNTRYGRVFEKLFQKQKLFRNQPNVKKITVFGRFVDFFDWKQAKLKEISINVTEASVMKKVFEGQDELEDLDVDDLNGACFNLILH